VNVETFIDHSSPKAKEETKQLVMSSVLHAADISTSLRDFDVSQIWADYLFEEFFNQGDVEKAQSLEVSFLCDRETTEIAAGQAGFISFVVLPVFKLLARLSPDVTNVQVASGEKNILKWKAKAQAIKDAQTAENEEKQ
jgi:hypothetical protein